MVEMSPTPAVGRGGGVTAGIVVQQSSFGRAAGLDHGLEVGGRVVLDVGGGVGVAGAGYEFGGVDDEFTLPFVRAPLGR